jgi:5-methylcytosine-specific restriction endonuclease McrA
MCGKPLYRRPSDTARSRFAACMLHRAEAQKVVGITDKQHDGLSRGRTKGTNHRTGYRHRAESKLKVAESNRAFWAAHPDKAIERGAKTRAENHYKWKGGISKLNKSIRQMNENRRWTDGVKARDGGCCTSCGSGEKIESHHIKSLCDLIAELGIKSRDDARKHADKLWDLANGETLCEACHYAEHGRSIAA